MGARRWERLARLAGRAQAGRFAIGAGVVAETSADFLVLHRTLNANHECALEIVPPPSEPFDIPGSTAWRHGRVSVSLDLEAPHQETIDVDRVVPPLQVRGPLPGDRFNPLGLGGSEQALNDFFRGRGVARGERAFTPLLCDRVGILWVVGHRIADRVRLTDQTTRRAGLWFEAS